MLADLRAEHGQLALCPGTFPTTSAARAEQMACDAAEAADGVTPTKVWASTGCLFLFALVPLGIAIIDMIEAGTMDLNHGGVWVSGLLCAALIILVIVLWRGYRNPSSDRNIAKRLMLGGLPARARVASITTSGSPEDARHMVHLDLEVAPRDRAPYRARTKVFASPSEQAELQVGASVAVRFDPEEPTQVALEPLVRRVLVRPSA
jgi:hypothetical protein